MTFIVNDNCIKCKFTDCVEVCPVDCFYEGENMLVIHPDECIDCGVCEPECPVEAIQADTDDGAEKWLELNRKFSEEWPNLTAKKEALSEADKFKDEKDKYEKYFSSKPGSGDQPEVLAIIEALKYKIKYFHPFLKGVATAVSLLQRC